MSSTHGVTRHWLRTRYPQAHTSATPKHQDIPRLAFVQPSDDITPDTAYAVGTSFAVQRWQLLYQRGCDILITL